MLFAMNRTELNISIPQTSCDYFLQLSPDHSTDILILRIYYPFTPLVIVISNGLLLQTFSKKTTKTRADKMFIILSSSDFGVGLISVPVVSLMLFITDCDILKILSPAVECFALFPYGFSWAVIVIIALDRVLIITTGHIYKKIITQKVLHCIIVIVLFDVITMAILNPMRGKMPGQVSEVIQYTQLTSETFSIFITFAAYIYLFIFVRLKSKVIANKRHCLNNFGKKLMMTVTYTYLCLLFFTVPQYAVIATYFIGAITDPTVQRNVHYWAMILVYSNLFANAWIILYNSREKKKSSKIKRKFYSQK